ncbi:hypothetical protein DIPPA_23012 [Diplonema papillatum]|nr:hypothetical protein DIPPA_23012 [Diplonema papillatum]
MRPRSERTAEVLTGCSEHTVREFLLALGKQRADELDAADVGLLAAVHQAVAEGRGGGGRGGGARSLFLELGGNADGTGTVATAVLRQAVDFIQAAPTAAKHAAPRPLPVGPSAQEAVTFVQFVTILLSARPAAKFGSPGFRPDNAPILPRPPPASLRCSDGKLHSFVARPSTARPAGPTHPLCPSLLRMPSRTPSKTGVSDGGFRRRQRQGSAGCPSTPQRPHPGRRPLSSRQRQLVPDSLRPTAPEKERSRQAARLTLFRAGDLVETTGEAAGGLLPSGSRGTVAAVHPDLLAIDVRFPGEPAPASLGSGETDCPVFAGALLGAPRPDEWPANQFASSESFRAADDIPRRSEQPGETDRPVFAGALLGGWAENQLAGSESFRAADDIPRRSEQPGETDRPVFAGALLGGWAENQLADSESLLSADGIPPGSEQPAGSVGETDRPVFAGPPHPGEWAANQCASPEFGAAAYDIPPRSEQPAGTAGETDPVFGSPLPGESAANQFADSETLRAAADNAPGLQRRSESGGGLAGLLPPPRGRGRSAEGAHPLDSPRRWQGSPPDAAEAPLALDGSGAEGAGRETDARAEGETRRLARGGSAAAGSEGGDREPGPAAAAPRDPAPDSPAKPKSLPSAVDADDQVGGEVPRVAHCIEGHAAGLGSDGEDSEPLHPPAPDSPAKPKTLPSAVSTDEQVGGEVQHVAHCIEGNAAGVGSKSEDSELLQPSPDSPSKLLPSAVDADEQVEGEVPDVAQSFEGRAAGEGSADDDKLLVSLAKRTSGSDQATSPQTQSRSDGPLAGAFPKAEGNAAPRDDNLPPLPQQGAVDPSAQLPSRASAVDDEPTRGEIPSPATLQASRPDDLLAAADADDSDAPAGPAALTDENLSLSPPRGASDPPPKRLSRVGGVDSEQTNDAAPNLQTSSPDSPFAAADAGDDSDQPGPPAKRSSHKVIDDDHRATDEAPDGSQAGVPPSAADAGESDTPDLPSKRPWRASAADREQTTDENARSPQTPSTDGRRPSVGGFGRLPSMDAGEPVDLSAKRPSRVSVVDGEWMNFERRSSQAPSTEGPLARGRLPSVDAGDPIVLSTRRPSRVSTVGGEGTNHERRSSHTASTEDALGGAFPPGNDGRVSSADAGDSYACPSANRPSHGVVYVSGSKNEDGRESISQVDQNLAASSPRADTLASPNPTRDPSPIPCSSLSPPPRTASNSSVPAACGAVPQANPQHPACTAGWSKRTSDNQSPVTFSIPCSSPVSPSREESDSGSASSARGAVAFRPEQASDSRSAASPVPLSRLAPPSRTESSAPNSSAPGLGRAAASNDPRNLPAALSPGSVVIRRLHVSLLRLSYPTEPHGLAVPERGALHANCKLPRFRKGDPVISLTEQRLRDREGALRRHELTRQGTAGVVEAALENGKLLVAVRPSDAAPEPQPSAAPRHHHHHDHDQVVQMPSARRPDPEPCAVSDSALRAQPASFIAALPHQLARCSVRSAADRAPVPGDIVMSTTQGLPCFPGGTLGTVTHVSPLGGVSVHVSQHYSDPALPPRRTWNRTVVAGMRDLKVVRPAAASANRPQLEHAPPYPPALEPPQQQQQQQQQQQSPPADPHEVAVLKHPIRPPDPNPELLPGASSAGGSGAAPPAASRSALSQLCQKLLVRHEMPETPAARTDCWRPCTSPQQHRAPCLPRAETRALYAVPPASIPAAAPLRPDPRRASEQQLNALLRKVGVLKQRVCLEAQRAAAKDAAIGNLEKELRSVRQRANRMRGRGNQAAAGGCPDADKEPVPPPLGGLY